MAIDLDTHRDPEGFPVDHPLDALKKDHDLVKQLFAQYLEIPQDMNERIDIGREILLRLDRHMTMEEDVFYPSVRMVDTRLVERCLDEHRNAHKLIKQIHNMDEGDQQFEAFLQLGNVIIAHMNAEEKELFPEVMLSNLDLSEIGAGMQACEVSIVTAEAPSLRKSERRI